MWMLHDTWLCRAVPPVCGVHTAALLLSLRCCITAVAAAFPGCRRIKLGSRSLDLADREMVAGL